MVSATAPCQVLAVAVWQHECIGRFLDTFLDCLAADLGDRQCAAQAAKPER